MKVKFDDFRKIDEEGYEKYVNKKLGELPVHQLIQHLSLQDLLCDFDEVSLCPSGMSYERVFYPRIERGYAFTSDMKNDLVENFNIQTFTQGSATLKIKYHNPPNLVVQHLPVQEKLKKSEINRMRNGYIVDDVTSVDIFEINEIGGKTFEIYKGFICRENLRVSLFEKVNDNLFGLRQKY